MNINVEERLLKIDYDIIKRLNNKLKDNNLSVIESKKVTDDIVKRKEKVLEREQEIYELKIVLEKRIRTCQARSFKDQNK